MNMKFDDCFIPFIERGEKIYSFRFSSHNNEVFVIGDRIYHVFVAQKMTVKDVLVFIDKRGFNPLHFGFVTFKSMKSYYITWFSKRNALDDDILYLHTW